MALDARLASQVVTVFVYAMLACSFLVLSRKGLVPGIYVFAVQSASLGAIGLLTAYATGHAELYVLALFNLVFKAVFVTWLLLVVVKRIHVQREISPLVGIPTSILALLLLTGAAFFLTRSIHAPARTLSPDALPVSLAILFNAVFTMVSRRKALTQALGLLMAENGALLAAVALTYGMPLLIEMGIFFDVLTVAVVLGIFLFRINETFSTIDTTGLRRLTD